MPSLSRRKSLRSRAPMISQDFSPAVSPAITSASPTARQRAPAALCGVYSFALGPQPYISPEEENHMRARTILLLTLALCFVGVGVCFASDLNIGTWKLNEAKSKTPPGMLQN